MVIHWIRHTTPDVAPNICYGQADLDVVGSFPDEADRVKSKLLPNYDHVFTSPLQRCTKLAAACLTQEATPDLRLMEYNFGDWELKSWDEIHGPKAQAWFDDFTNNSSPNGESLLDMKHRVLDFYTELLATEFETAAVFCHSGVQRIIHAEILSTPLTDIFKLQLDYGAVIETKYSKSHGSMNVRHL